MDHDPRSKHRRGPAYSFGMRGKQETIGSGPGPRYNPETKLCRPSPPSYSMHFRPKDQDNFKTPGPGTYAFVETGEAVGRPKAPAYNFGSRPKERRTDNTPGNNLNWKLINSDINLLLCLILFVLFVLLYSFGIIIV